MVLIKWYCAQVACIIIFLFSVTVSVIGVANHERNYYDLLGVSRNAQISDIKKAFRNLAKRYHPDKSTDQDAENKFKRISTAYEVLTDPLKRQIYDQLGHRTGFRMNNQHFQSNHADHDFSHQYFTSFNHFFNQQTFSNSNHFNEEFDHDSFQDLFHHRFTGSPDQQRKQYERAKRKICFYNKLCQNQRCFMIKQCKTSRKKR